MPKRKRCRACPLRGQEVCTAFTMVLVSIARMHIDLHHCASLDIDTVHNWLKSLKMDEYTKSFERDGFDTLRGVATIDEDDLIDMRVKKGHRRVVLSHIEELRNQLALLDENSNSAGQEPDSSPTLSMLPAITKQLSSSSLVSGGSDAAPARMERRGSLTGLLLDA